MEKIETLEIPMNENEAGAKTIGEYLKMLLLKLWEEGESFSGKRPFGNSDWEYDLYYALARAGAVMADVDKDGDVLSYDMAKANALIFQAIEDVFE